MSNEGVHRQVVQALRACAARLVEYEDCESDRCGACIGCIEQEQSGKWRDCVGPRCNDCRGCANHAARCAAEAALAAYEAEAHHSNNECQAALAEASETAEANGAFKERADIVKWLRTVYALNRNARDFADAIEMCEHQKETP